MKPLRKKFFIETAAGEQAFYVYTMDFKIRVWRIFGITVKTIKNNGFDVACFTKREEATKFMFLKQKEFIQALRLCNS